MPGGVRGGPGAAGARRRAGDRQDVLWEAGVAEAASAATGCWCTAASGRGGFRVRRAVGSGRAGVRGGGRRARGASAPGAGGRAAAEPTRARSRREPHAIGLALLDVLRALSRDAPVLVALDDLQWLDASSASVLPAALRRLDAERVGLLATVARARRRRCEHGSPPGVRRPVARAAGARRLHELLRERLGIELARPQLARLYEISGGNPYFALELARAPDGRVPESLRDVLGRAHRLSARADRRGAPAGRGARAADGAARLRRARRRRGRARCAGGRRRRARRRRRATALRAPAARVAVLRARDTGSQARRPPPARRGRHRHRGARPPPRAGEHRAGRRDVRPSSTRRRRARPPAARRIAAAELAELAAEHTPPGDATDLQRRRLAAGGCNGWPATWNGRRRSTRSSWLHAARPRPRRAALRHGAQRRTALRGARRAVRAGDSGGRRGPAGDRALRPARRCTAGSRATRLAGWLPPERACCGPSASATRGSSRSPSPTWATSETWSLDITPGLLEPAARRRRRPSTLRCPSTRARACRSRRSSCTAATRRGGGRSSRTACTDEREGAEHTRGFVYFFLPWRSGCWGAGTHARDYARLLREYTAQAHDPDYGVYRQLPQRPRRGRPRAVRRGSRGTRRTASATRPRSAICRTASRPKGCWATSTSWPAMSTALSGDCARFPTGCSGRATTTGCW